jgi:hypothetical protein
VAVDSAEVKFFALPVRKRHLANLSRDALLGILRREMEDNTTLEHWLPGDVIADALSDQKFKDELIRDPANVLKERGYSPPARQIIVLENSESTYHLVLTESPSRQSDLDLRSLEESLVEKYGVNTTKCCASGTCAGGGRSASTDPPRGTGGLSRRTSTRQPPLPRSLVGKSFPATPGEAGEQPGRGVYAQVLSS